MTVEQLAKTLKFEIANGGGALKKTVYGGYCGDLLSWVMGARRKEVRGLP